MKKNAKKTVKKTNNEIIDHDVLEYMELHDKIDTKCREIFKIFLEGAQNSNTYFDSFTVEDNTSTIYYRDADDDTLDSIVFPTEWITFDYDRILAEYEKRNISEWSL